MTRFSGDLLFAGPDFSELLQSLRLATGELDRASNAWPGLQFEQLAAAGVLGWVIPREYGGDEIGAVELLQGYEQLAAACLTTAFILTQRNGACQRIAGSKNESLKRELLPELCAGRRFATVGISHLTTSRQHLAQPAVSATFTGSDLILDGLVPWVTGGVHADEIVTGGTCDDGTQVLAVVETAAQGVEQLPAPRLLALNASQTGAVRLNRVKIPRDRLIAGPAEQVMKQGAGGAGSLTTSALALGAAAGTLAALSAEAVARPDLQRVVETFDLERDRLVREMHQLAQAGAPTGMLTQSIEAIRQRANSLALRTSQAYLASSKGAGFVAGHPAERAVREAMFFLVWSCPQPVLAATLRDLACLLD